MRLKYLFLQFLKYRLTARVHSARRREIVHRRARHIIPKIVSIFSICGQSYKCSPVINSNLMVVRYAIF